MNLKVFVDTNILVYAHTNSAGSKHARARKLVEDLWVSGRAALSTQVLQELCFNLQRKVHPPLPVDEVRRLVQDYLSWEMVVNDGSSVIQALDIEQRYQISFWDALIIQAADFCGAAVIYSEDFAHGQKYGSVEVVNPLA
jgi:predicted nucleic acid-binding protein